MSETITIKFKAKDENLVKTITELANAQAKFNNSVKSGNTSADNAAKSNNSLKNSVANLSAKLEAHGKTWKHLGVSQNLVKKAQDGCRVSLEKLRIAMKKANRQGLLGTRNNRLLANSFATLRSKMLLVSFGATLIVKPLIRIAEESAKLESVENAFNTLAGATENSSSAMARLRDATNGTMSDFDLFKQANNAMVLGVSKNSEEMAELFDMAQRLGRALGRDTASSVESLVTGIGRQSRLMLDNVGIIVKAEDAYKAFAKANNLTVDSLTDAQKKQAFFNATIKSARESIKKLGDETLTTQDRFDRFNSTMSNFSSFIGAKVAPSVLGFLESWAGWMQEITETDLETTIRQLRELKVPEQDIEPLIETNKFKQAKKVIKDLGADLRFFFQHNQEGAVLTNRELELMGISFENMAKGVGKGGIAQTRYVKNLDISSLSMETLTALQQKARFEGQQLTGLLNVQSDMWKKESKFASDYSRVLEDVMNETQREIAVINKREDAITTLIGFLTEYSAANKIVEGSVKDSSKTESENSEALERKWEKTAKVIKAEAQLQKVINERNQAVRGLTNISEQENEINENSIKFKEKVAKLDAKIAEQKDKLKTATQDEEEEIVQLILAFKKEIGVNEELEKIYREVIKKKHELIKVSREEAQQKELLAGRDKINESYREMTLLMHKLEGRTDKFIKLKELEFNLDREQIKSKREINSLQEANDKILAKGDGTLKGLTETQLDEFNHNKDKIAQLKEMSDVIRFLIEDQMRLVEVNKSMESPESIQMELDTEFNKFPAPDPQDFQSWEDAFKKVSFGAFNADALWKDSGKFLELTGQTLDKWLFQNHDALLKRNELADKSEKARDEIIAVARVKRDADRLAANQINFATEEDKNAHLNEITKNFNDAEAAAQIQHNKNMDNIQTQYNMARIAKLNENLQMVQGMANTLTAGLKSDLDQRINNELNALKESAAYQNASSERREDMENSVRRKYAAEQQKVFKLEQASKLADVYFNTSAAVMKSVSASPLTYGMPWSGIAAAMGAMQASQILSQQPPTYQYGGLVGGNRHSQGGTMIEAERGEFVMQRRAVQSLGVETMNRINEGGGGGSNVTVNVSGNVLTSDYVEGELAEAIREASRRGVEFN